ncbi:MAG TPA: PAS domain-containing protein, partial [Gemmatimonadaceae bacterium]|nr:PAS domain-containing protein [Gemmatimonadaceae bacterium]
MSILPGFLQNTALLLTLGLILDLRTRHAAFDERGGRVGFGLLLGLASIVTMLFPVRLEPGVVLDSRGLLLAISGLFFGLIPTAVAMAVATLYRVFGIGGPSVVTGVAFIFGSGGLGLALRFWHRSRQQAKTKIPWIVFPVLGLAVAAFQLGLTWRLLAPADRGVFWTLAPTLLAVSAVATFIMGILLQDRFRHVEVVDRLAERERSFRILAEQLPAIIYRAARDDASSTLYVSPAIRELGYEPEEWIADPSLFVEHLHPDDRDRVLAELEEDRRLERASELVYRFRHRDGHYLTIRDSAQIVRDDQGRPLYLQGVMMN